MNSIKQEIIADIRKAKQSVKVAVAWLTDSDFVAALAQKITKKQDFIIEIVVSGHQDNKEIVLKTKMMALMELGAVVKTYGSANPQDGEFMHCKFYIIDDEFAKSGSYNWSKGAEKNVECLDEVALEPKQKLFRKLFGNGRVYAILKK
jgi:phosphatidylserine/phosphatidylglycerophosphate/cardiolipin synthase-like enzyme